MSGEMERLRRALIEASPLPPHPQVADHLVRTVLRAIREPGEGMRSAVRKFYAPSFPDSPQLAEGWVDASVENLQRMIDHILSEPTP